MIMLLAMVYVCNYHCSTCILKKMIHLHTPNHRFHNKLNPISMVLYVTLDNLLIQWYNVNMVVMRFENCQNTLLNGKIYSNEMLMKTPDSCRILLKELCNLDPSVRNCMYSIMKKIFLSLNYTLSHTVYKFGKLKCHSALINKLCMTMMTTQKVITMLLQILLIMIECTTKNLIQSAFIPALISQKVPSKIEIHIHTSNLCVLKFLLASLNPPLGVWLLQKPRKFKIMKANVSIKKHCIFWSHLKALIRQKTMKCHPITILYIESVCLEVSFGTINSIFWCWVFQKSKKTKKFHTKIIQKVECQACQVQNEATSGLLSITLSNKNIDSMEVPKLEKNRFLMTNTECDTTYVYKAKM